MAQRSGELQGTRFAGARKAWTGETHYAVSIIQADDRWDLEHAWVNRGDSADLYPGTLEKNAFGNQTLPNSTSYYFWGGSAPLFGYSGVTVEDIEETDGTVTATLRYTPLSPASGTGP